MFNNRVRPATNNDNPVRPTTFLSRLLGCFGFGDNRQQLEEEGGQVLHFRYYANGDGPVETRDQAYAHAIQTIAEVEARLKREAETGVAQLALTTSDEQSVVRIEERREGSESSREEAHWSDGREALTVFQIFGQDGGQNVLEPGPGMGN